MPLPGEAVRPPGDPSGPAVADPSAAFHLFAAMSCPDGLEAMQARARDLAPMFEPTSNGGVFASLMQGVAEQLRGSPTAAEGHLVAAERASSGRLPAQHALTSGQLALNRFALGLWTDASHIIRIALVEVADRRLGSHPLMANVFATAALTYPDPLADWVDHSLRLCDELGDYAPWLTSQTMVVAAAAEVAAGNHDHARAILDRAGASLVRIEDASGLRAFNRALRLELLAGEDSEPVDTRDLTSVEVALLRHLSGPLTLAEIAHRRVVSRNTVKSQTTSVYRKLGVADRPAAVARARALGLI